ncbi:hypothetical protein PRUPE_4G288600 [Prunus persica]|uniref:Uncharacterized protein n=1 Tax=Prunus persica TaxID=3760 RepID=A0A251PSQ7_PRUPE|nr:uncharacterized protein LOC18781329 isoform X1 [Prunus persica]ONI14614.1 hypothetical protein PRUPE_4G288600 [Prunus persica]ONI14615.1 hypothetical protein PRUPE_4G288600 [Prunus persica]
MMENGYDGKFAEKFSGLAISNAADTIRSSNANHNHQDDSSLFQVMKAVEAAEATIKQQVEENLRLRTELQHKILELDRFKLDESMAQRSPSVDPWSEGLQTSFQAHQPVPTVDGQDNRIKSVRNTYVVLHQESQNPTTDAPIQSHAETQSNNGTINGTMKLPTDNAGSSHLSSPSTTSFSPGRFNTVGEYDPRFNFSGQGLMPMAELNTPSSLWKQDLSVKIHEHEEEIMQLRKHLANYSIKEAQIRNEKYVLEKRIAYMRLAFDQQQQDLVDAASKALSYRQDIIEENIRLTYALQDAQQERSTFVSSLLPLLAEYSLQPPVPDAQSIVSNVKVLFKHLQEKLLLTETKLKESQYQLGPWRSDSNHSNIAPQSPSHSIGAALATSNKNGLELVPQPIYSHETVPVSTSDAQTTTEWDLLGRHQSGLGGVVTNNMKANGLGRYSPIESRTSAAQDVPTQLAVTQGDAQVTRYSEETTNKQVTFRDPVRNSESDYQDPEGNHNERETSANWNSGNAPYTTALDDPSSSYAHYLPPVLEEPSSSFSEAADDDPLPAIDGLQISGEAFPGRELQACGYSINGTTSCNFEWVRHREDGSVYYIDGAKQPNYLVTADDVETYLAIEVQPLDNRKRKGELVKVFANEHKKITCDPEMQSHIEKILGSGHASFKIYLSTGYLDIWEPATLAIKREAYSIKCSETSGVVLTEKFSPTTLVTIPYGSPTELIISNPGGGEHILKTDDSSTDISCSRDTIVLTLRLFILRAGERRKGKKRLFF